MRTPLIIVCLISTYCADILAKESSVLSDPTRPLINTKTVVTESVVKQDSTQKLAPKNRLQAIYYESKVKKAVIDNQLVSVGEKVNGYTVERIEARQVVLRLGKVQKKLRLSPSIKVVNKKG